MKREYIDIPIFTTYNEIINKNHTLSATQYKSFNIANENTKAVSDFLYRDLTRDDLGHEVGSEAYVDDSTYYFIKTKALQPETYLLDINKESFQCIIPKSFVTSNLKKGDLIISKDSNVGEIAILDKDYPNCMLCGGIYKLPVKENKYYLLAFIKSELFRQQIDFIVPRGSTIRHGKKKFLECLIPIPNKNAENTIKYVEFLMQAIINKEQKIIERYRMCSGVIEKELKENQKENTFSYSLPSVNELIKNQRMDTKIYSQEYKETYFLVENYANGSFTIPYKNISGGNTPTKRIISEDDIFNYYWVTPSIFSDYGLLTDKNTINCHRVNINKNILLLVNRTSKGGEGKYVGMSFFYDVEELGKGHYNQGIYGISNLPDQDLYFINALINSSIYRILFSKLSMGSKMKEIKMKQVSELKFPSFPSEVKMQIVTLYHNADSIYNANNCSLENFLDYDNDFNSRAGIYELDKSLKYLKKRLENTIDDIANNREVITEF